MALSWFSPAVPVTTGEMGPTYHCSNVEGAAAELLKWNKRGPTGRKQSAPAWPVLPIKRRRKRPGGCSVSQPRRRVRFGRMSTETAREMRQTVEAMSQVLYLTSTFRNAD